MPWAWHSSAPACLKFANNISYISLAQLQLSFVKIIWKIDRTKNFLSSYGTVALLLQLTSGFSRFHIHQTNCLIKQKYMDVIVQFSIIGYAIVNIFQIPIIFRSASSSRNRSCKKNKKNRMKKFQIAITSSLPLLLAP